MKRLKRLGRLPLGSLVAAALFCFMVAVAPTEGKIGVAELSSVNKPVYRSASSRSGRQSPLIVPPAITRGALRGTTVHLDQPTGRMLFIGPMNSNNGTTDVNIEILVVAGFAVVFDPGSDWHLHSYVQYHSSSNAGAIWAR